MSLFRLTSSLALSFAAAVYFGGCASTGTSGGGASTAGGADVKPVAVPPVVRRATKPFHQPLVIAYQSNRGGEIEPCGCESSPFGGIDREANALAKQRKDKTPLFFVDAGNMYAAEASKLSKEQAQDKGTAITEMLNTLGLEVFAPGPYDYALGYDWLQKVQGSAKFKFVSTNVQKPGGAPAFDPMVIVKKGALTLAVLSITPVDAPGVKAAGLQTVDVNQALNEWLPKARAQADVVVVLSQRGYYADQDLIRARGDLDLVVGSEPTLQTPQAYWYGPATLYVDPDHSGHMYSRLKVDFQIPLKGFYNDKEIAENQSRLLGLEQTAQANPGDEKAKKRVAEYKKFKLLEKVAGASRFDNEITPLDEKTFGKPNALTKLAQKYRAHVRERALKQ